MIDITICHQLLLSVYVPFLVVTVHESDGGRNWANRLVHWGVSHHFLWSSVGIEDYRVDVIDCLLVWVSAVVIFACLLVLRRLSDQDIVLKYFSGLFALAGFPIAVLYLTTVHLFSVNASAIVVISGLVLFLWTRRKWLVPPPLNILIVVLYNIVWSVLCRGLGRGWLIFWPSWHWTWPIWKYMWLAYPVFATCLTIVWARYFRNSEAHDVAGPLPGV